MLASYSAILITQTLACRQLITPIIMAGGAGTVLWPASSESMPKQFMPLFGDRSSHQETLARVSDAAQFYNPVVITSCDFRFLAAEQARALGIEAGIVLEPVRRDAGPAVAVAPHLALLRSPEMVVLMLAADLFMSDRNACCKSCEDALPAAKAGHIVTFGIKPTELSTAVGYLKPQQRFFSCPTEPGSAPSSRP